MLERGFGVSVLQCITTKQPCGDIALHPKLKRHTTVSYHE